MLQLNGNNKLSTEIRQKSIEKASNPAYDEKNIDINKDMSKEELEKKLNDLEVTYEILEKGATSEEKLQFYTNTKNEIKSLQEKLTNIDTNTYSTLSNSSNSLKNIENSYKKLRINLGLDN